MSIRSSKWWSVGAMAAVTTLALLLLCAMSPAGRQNAPRYDQPPISYSTTPPRDAVTRLQQRLDSGRLKLAYDSRRGYLPAVLEALHIPVSSQALVFSKTSFQRKLISPKTPRALYFNEDVYIGWLPDAPHMEVATMDPRLGPVYYVLPQDPKQPPRFIRQNTECLQCHASVMTGALPGHILRSVFTGDDGGPILSESSYLTTDQSPLKERWGGWYVTGKCGSQLHMGNKLMDTDVTYDPKAGTNVTSLATYLDASRYPTAHSDLVALLVLAHQTTVQNLIVHAGYGTRAALHHPGAGGKPVSEEIAAACEPLVKGLLCANEAPLAEPVAGTSGFTAEFQRTGPKDHRGRSLRDLDLTKRLFRYPCSYLIYSEAFDGLPHEAKLYVYRRLWEILTGKDRSPDFARLSIQDRRAIQEILLDTKPAFAANRPRD